MAQDNVEVVKRSGEAFLRAHRGYDGIRSAHRPFFAQFEQVTFEPYDFVDVGDRVVVSVHVVGRGRESGVEVEREVPVVFTLYRTKIIRAEVFSSRRDALEAAGLRQ